MHLAGDQSARSPTQPRRAELVAALSLATDLGMGHPSEHELRVCLLSMRVGRALALDEANLRDVYHVALLRWVGCTAHAREFAAWFGDDIESHRRVATADFGRPSELPRRMVGMAGMGRPPLDRALALATVLAAGPKTGREINRDSCEVAMRLGGRMRFGSGVIQALGHMFERWDGRGQPNGLQGDEIALPARIVYMAQDIAVFIETVGPEAAVEVARKRRGTAYDPALVDAFTSGVAELVVGLVDEPVWEEVMALEPGTQDRLDDAGLGACLEAMADFTDLKTPQMAGHSRGVADLAATAALEHGLSQTDAELVRRAGLVHDLGRSGVSNSIWDKPGPLSEREWERVRLHPYFTERMLARPPVLERLGTIAALHHERLDGSGYHRQAVAAALSAGARILAAADAYHAMTEPRPYRPPLSRKDAARELRDDVHRGRIDARAADAVLAAAGHQVGRRAHLPAGLTARELDVLRLLARGLSNREMARALMITEKTVGHHVEHIYGKIGCAARPTATLFAMEHGLLDPAL